MKEIPAIEYFLIDCAREVLFTFIRAHSSFIHLFTTFGLYFISPTTGSYLVFYVMLDIVIAISIAVADVASVIFVVVLAVIVGVMFMLMWMRLMYAHVMTTIIIPLQIENLVIVYR
ncbi:hypothetical protein GQX74_013883 [Glossina fuscipes]|nr:hypothetical protein GQX74_013883 [Glossina fuscipes]